MLLKLKDFPSSERPRERMVSLGPSALSDSELLAIILRTGTKNLNVLQLSNRILSDFNFEYLSNTSVNEMINIYGLGPAKACQIVAAFELSKRISKYNITRKNKIESSNDIFNFLGPEVSYLKKEHLIGVFLNKRNRIIKKETIFIGSLDSTIIHPREIFKAAINNSSSAVILVHNHPSGNPKPSKDDIIITEQIIEAGKLLGIFVLDHIIIGQNEYYSMKEKNEEIF